MKKLLASLLLAFPLLAMPSHAWATDFGPWSVDAGFKYYVNITCNGHTYSCTQKEVPCLENSGPWYLYWPYEAHFQTMTAPVFPYWPAAKAATAPVRPASAQAANVAAYQPVGYYYYPRTTPNYWYGR